MLELGYVLEDLTVRRAEAGADGEALGKVGGLAIPYNKWSEDLSGFKVFERFNSGAFKDVLSQKPDVAFVRNHDPDKIMARTPDTLRLEEGDRGVRFDADVAPVSYAADMLVSLQRGDLKHASFRYRANPKDVTWREINGRLERTVEKADGLRDITVATFPAYRQTRVALMRTLVEAERAVMSDDIVRALAEACGDASAAVQQKATGADERTEVEALRTKCEALEVERGQWRSRMADMQREIDALARMRAWLLTRV